MRALGFHAEAPAKISAPNLNIHRSIPQDKAVT
jgi:hypothetical protein